MEGPRKMVIGRGNSTFESPNVKTSLAQRTDMTGLQLVESGQGAQVRTHRTFEHTELTSAAKGSCFLAQKSWESGLVS